MTTTETKMQILIARAWSWCSRSLSSGSARSGTGSRLKFTTESGEAEKATLVEIASALNTPSGLRVQ
jgi:hypothetical protein